MHAFDHTTLEFLFQKYTMISCSQDLPKTIQAFTANHEAGMRARNHGVLEDATTRHDGLRLSPDA